MSASVSAICSALERSASSICLAVISPSVSLIFSSRKSSCSSVNSCLDWSNASVFSGTLWMSC